MIQVTYSSSKDKCNTHTKRVALAFINITLEVATIDIPLCEECLLTLNLELTKALHNAKHK